MKLSSILSSALLSSLVTLSRAEKYNVVALPVEYGGTGVGLVIDDGTPIVMAPSINDMFWTVEANKPSNDYYYVIITQDSITYSEKANLSFSRTWGKGKSDSETYNQVFGNRYDHAGELLKTIPRIHEARKGCTKYSQLFQEGQVPVVRVQISDQDYNTLIADTGSNKENKYIGTMDFFTPDDVFQYTNIEFEVGGMGSSVYKKHPFKVSLSENKEDPKSNTELFDRDSFKLRNAVYDDSYIKGKIASDILTSLGVPTPQVGFARLYVNNTPFGLYELSESIKKKFVRNMFHTDTKKDDVKYGTLYKGVSLSSEEIKIPAFLYNDYPEYRDKLYQYAKKVVRDGAQPYDDLLEVLAWFDTLNENTPEQEIRNRFDVDVFLRGMALEYLICQWDGYLQGGNNFYIYRNPDGYITMFPFDFDLTFGKWCNFEKVPFEAFAQSKKPYGTKGLIFAQLYNKILNREPFKTEMKNVIDDTVSRLFNIEALGDRILYFKEFLRDQFVWDIASREILPTQTYEGEEDIPPPNYDGVMALLSGQETDIDDYGIYRWVTDVSNYIATNDNIKFNVSNKDGEVGGIIEIKKNGKSKVDGEVNSSAYSLSKYLINTAALIFVVILNQYLN